MQSGHISGEVTYTANIQMLEGPLCVNAEQRRVSQPVPYHILVDAGNPQATISFPDSGGIVKIEDNIRGEATDDYQLGAIYGGTQHYSFLGTRTGHDDGGTIYFNDDSLRSASWELPVSAVTTCKGILQGATFYLSDAVGNTTEVNHSMYVDCAAPIISINEPAGGGWTDPSKPAIKGNASDDIALDKIWLTIKDETADRYWDGSDWVAGGALIAVAGGAGEKTTEWTYSGLTKDNLRSGVYSIRAYARDKVGRIGSATGGSAYKNRIYLGNKKFTAFDVNVKTVTNERRTTAQDSFTTLSSDNSIFVLAEIIPARVAAELSGNVKWTVQGLNTPSGTPSEPVWGNPSRFRVAVPPVPVYSYPEGRRAAMGYGVYARVEQEGGNLGSARKDISQDNIDKCRQEYEDFKVGKVVGQLYVPTRNEFANSGQSSGGHFTFSNLSGGDYPFAIVKQSLYEGLECLREQIQRLDGLGSRELEIVGGYRNPQHNYDIGQGPDQEPGAHDSSHQWGVAADIRWFDLTDDGEIDTDDFVEFNNIARNQCGAAYTEPYVQAKNHYHVNWSR